MENFPNISISGVGHTEDLGYLFDYGKNGTQTDYLVRDRYVRLVANFAKCGNPTPKKDSLLENIVWPANQGSSVIQQLNITASLQIVTNPFQANMDFWKRYYDKYGKAPLDTY